MVACYLYVVNPETMLDEISLEQGDSRNKYFLAESSRFRPKDPGTSARQVKGQDVLSHCSFN